jgi:hypothetical protein
MRRLAAVRGWDWLILTQARSTTFRARQRLLLLPGSQQQHTLELSQIVRERGAGPELV